MLAYGVNILKLSLVISIISAGLLYLAVRRFMVKPIKGVVSSMLAYSEQPEDVRRIMQPKPRIKELRRSRGYPCKSAEQQLTGSLKQKERLGTAWGRGCQDQPRFAQYS